MPTATAITTSDVVFTNLGPLTTVFTAPAACSTREPDLYLGWMEGDRVGGISGRKYCEDLEVPPLGDCWPSGSVLDAAHSSIVDNGGYVNGRIHYFSPASQCPSDYVTVGIAAKDDEGSLSTSGAFVPPVVTGYPPFYGFNPVNNIFVQEVLDKGETAVICCPKDHTLGLFGDGCFKQYPQSAYGEKTICNAWVSGASHVTWANVTYTYNNTVVTDNVPKITATSMSAYTTETRTLTGEEAETVTPYGYADAIYLVHRPADATGTGGAAAPTNSTGSGSRMAASGSGLGVLATVWILAALAGVAFAVPW